MKIPSPLFFSQSKMGMVAQGLKKGINLEMISVHNLRVRVMALHHNFRYTTTRRATLQLQ